MSRHTWFRLAIRLLGLALVGLGLTSAFDVLGSVVRAWQSEWAGEYEYRAYWLTSGLGSLLQLMFGLYCVMGAPALVRWCLRDVDITCPRCGYNCSQVTTGKCPECGLRLDAPPPVQSSTPDDRADPPVII